MTTAHYPVLPVAGNALLRGLASLLVLVTHWLKQLARARRNRREANVLAGLDRRMLADIGISSSDVRDAFSTPFWGDPTELLNARAHERRRSRPLPRPRATPAPQEFGAAYAQPAHRRALPLL